MRFWTGLSVALLIVLAASPLGAQRLDGIAAVVNNEVVLQSDVEEQLSLFLAQARMRPDSALVDTLRKQVLEQMIDDKLVVAEAKRQGVAANEAEIKKQLDAAIAQKKEEMGGDANFVAALKQENITEAQLRDKYRAEVERQLVRSRFLERQFPRKPVPQAEAEAYFKAHMDRFPKVPAEIKVAVIQIPPMPDSLAEARGRAKAVAARRRILAGEKFAKVAADVSDDQSSAKSGGDLGFFAQGTMEPSLENVAFSIKLNTVSEPVRTPYGWHLVEVLDRDTLKTAAHRDSLGPDRKPLLEAHARHILIRVPLGDADVERAKKLAERVRSEAVKGTPFATLVHRYSRYEGPHDPDGTLAFLPIQQFQPEIRAGLDSLAIGEVSEVLTNQLGFNIFKVIDRHPERTYTIDEIRKELPDAVAEVQSRDKYEAWVKDLRAKAQIQYR